MKGTLLAFVSAFVVLNTTWLYSIISSFDKDVLQWIEEKNTKKIVHRRASESQTDPDKQIQTDKECDSVLCMRCVRSKAWGKTQKCYS